MLIDWPKLLTGAAVGLAISQYLAWLSSRELRQIAGAFAEIAEQQELVKGNATRRGESRLSHHSRYGKPCVTTFNGFRRRQGHSTPQRSSAVRPGHFFVQVPRTLRACAVPLDLRHGYLIHDLPCARGSRAASGIRSRQHPTRPPRSRPAHDDQDARGHHPSKPWRKPSV